MSIKIELLFGIKATKGAKYNKPFPGVLAVLKRNIDWVVVPRAGEAVIFSKAEFDVTDEYPVVDSVAHEIEKGLVTVWLGDLDWGDMIKLMKLKRGWELGSGAD